MQASCFCHGTLLELPYMSPLLRPFGCPAPSALLCMYAVPGQPATLVHLGQRGVQWGRRAAVIPVTAKFYPKCPVLLRPSCLSSRRRSGSASLESVPVAPPALDRFPVGFHVVRTPPQLPAYDPAGWGPESGVCPTAVVAEGSPPSQPSPICTYMRSFFLLQPYFTSMQRRLTDILVVS